MKKLKFNNLNVVRAFKILGIFYILFGIYCIFFDCKYFFDSEMDYPKNKYIVGSTLIIGGFCLYKLYSIVLKILKSE